MTLRTVLIVVLALVFGGAAAVYATNAINRNREEHNPDKIDVVIATTTVNPGKALHEGMLTVKKVVKGEEPEDAVHDIAELTKNGGRVTGVKIVKGASIQKSMLLDEGVREGMATLIRKNDKDEKVWMQAANILTPTPSAGVGGFILPGDFVDVLLTVDRAPGEERGGMVRRLMQRVEVLAADTRTEANQNNVEGKIIEHRELRHVTLLVRPQQGQELALAQKQGTLTLILRNPEDTTVLPDTPVTVDDLKLVSKREEKKPEVVPPAPAKKVEPPPPIRGFFGVREYPIFLP